MADELNCRKCDDKECPLPAHYLVWTKPQYYCQLHARAMLRIGEAMGYPTAAATLRPMTPDEMLPDDTERSAREE